VTRLRTGLRAKPHVGRTISIYNGPGRLCHRSVGRQRPRALGEVLGPRQSPICIKRPSPPLAAIALAALLGAIFFTALPALAQPILTITPITWNVVGLDSNDVNSGPNNFPVGARVCNTGDSAATNVTSTFVWDSADAFINLRPGSLTQFTGADAVASLTAGSCHEAASVGRHRSTRERD